jgi:5-methylcytosine-specific restriction endonuclease McrA
MVNTSPEWQTRYKTLEAKKQQIITSQLKLCKKCNIEKSLENFGVNTSVYDGFSNKCKQCINDLRMQYYWANKEKENEKSRIYWKSHPERRVIQKLKRNIDEERQERERNAAVNRYWKNRDLRLAYTREYRKKNPDKILAHTRNRRARLENAEGNFTSKEWSILCKIFGNCCLCCGSSENLHADHIIPLTKGGNNFISNIQPLCCRCNISKGNRIIVDYRLKSKLITSNLPIKIYV